MHASVLGICLRKDQPWRRSSVVSHFFPDAKTKFPHLLLFQCCFLMLAVAAAVARCTPDNCTFQTLDLLYVSLFGEFISSPDRMCLQGDDIDDPWVAAAVPCASWQPESDVRKSRAWSTPFILNCLRLEDSVKILRSRLFMSIQASWPSNLQSLDSKLSDVEMMWNRETTDFPVSMFWSKARPFKVSKIKNSEPFSKMFDQRKKNR